MAQLLVQYDGARLEPAFNGEDALVLFEGAGRESLGGGFGEPAGGSDLHPVVGTQLPTPVHGPVADGFLDGTGGGGLGLAPPFDLPGAAVGVADGGPGTPPSVMRVRSDSAVCPDGIGGSAHGQGPYRDWQQLPGYSRKMVETEGSVEGPGGVL